MCFCAHRQAVSGASLVPSWSFKLAACAASAYAIYPKHKIPGRTSPRTHTAQPCRSANTVEASSKPTLRFYRCLGAFCRPIRRSAAHSRSSSLPQGPYKNFLKAATRVRAFEGRIKAAGEEFPSSARSVAAPARAIGAIRSRRCLCRIAGRIKRKAWRASATPFLL